MTHAAETSTHRITLDFEDAETLVLALEHIGDRDAPVMITGGSVTAGGPTYQLWAGYTPALRALEAQDREMTASDLIRAVREEAAADPDRVYEGPSQTTCEYADANGNPLCLIGHALARLAWLDRIPEVGNAAAISGILTDDWRETMKSTSTQRAWLHYVQKSQDARQSWGQAVDEADHLMGPIG